ncbi:autotransporter domain-containing protein [Bordetella hinzii]|uniref:autotransporter domain-containing protein n=1 Tax=Bordetella hinzii TaxID=103855 RepID=UPI0011530978|nr:autotransporter domain-containing protein [Bordetella hinzii]
MPHPSVARPRLRPLTLAIALALASPAAWPASYGLIGSGGDGGTGGFTGAGGGGGIGGGGGAGGPTLNAGYAAGGAGGGLRAGADGVAPTGGSSPGAGGGAGGAPQTGGSAGLGGGGGGMSAIYTGGGGGLGANGGAGWEPIGQGGNSQPLTHLVTGATQPAAGYDGGGARAASWAMLTDGQASTDVLGVGGGGGGGGASNGGSGTAGSLTLSGSDVSILGSALVGGGGGGGGYIGNGGAGGDGTLTLLDGTSLSVGDTLLVGGSAGGRGEGLGGAGGAGKIDMVDSTIVIGKNLILGGYSSSSATGGSGELSIGTTTNGAAAINFQPGASFTINPNGTLRVGVALYGAAFNGLDRLTNNGNIFLTQADASYVFRPGLTGNGKVTINTIGTTILNGDLSAYNGSIAAVGLGALQIGDAGSTWASASGQISGDSQLIFGQDADLIFGGSIAGSGGLTHAGAGRLTLTRTNQVNGEIVVDRGTLALDGGSLIAPSGKLSVGTAANAGVELRNGAMLETHDANVGVAGTGSVKIGGGSSWLSNFAYIGYTNTGSLVIDSGGTATSARGVVGLAGDGSVMVSDAGSRWEASTGLLMNPQGGRQSSLTIANGGTVTARQVELGSGGGTGKSTISLQGDSTARGVLETGGIILHGADAALDFNGGILKATQDSTDFLSNIGAAQTQLTGGGLLFDTNGHQVTITSQLNGTGDLSKLGTGTLTVNRIDSTGAVGVLAGTLKLGSSQAMVTGANSVSVADGAILDLNGYEATVGRLAGDGRVAVNDAVLTVGGSNHDSTFGGIISGTGRLTKTGTGKLTLTGANDYTGMTYILAGTLAAGAANTLGRGSLAVGSPAVLDLGAYSQTVGDFLGTGTVALGGATLTTNTTGSTIFFGRLTGTGNFVKQGGGVVSLAGTSDYVGTTHVQQGSLLFLNSAALAPGALRIDAGASAYLDPAGIYSVSSLAGGGVLDLGSAPLNVGDSNSTQFTGVLAGTGGALFKTNTGTLTLSGDNTYSGNTGVLGGTLRVDGSIARSSSVTVYAGGTLAGEGVVSATTVKAGGILAPGSAGSVLTVNGALTLEQGSRLNVVLGAPGTPAAPGASSGLRVAGDLSLDGTLNLASSASDLIGYYRLISYGGALSGNGLTIGNTPVGYLPAQFTTVQNVPGNIDLKVTTLGDNALQTWQGAGGSWTTAGAQWFNDGGQTPVAWAGNHAVFMGTAGTVSVDNAASFKGLQFVSDGWQLAGAAALTTDAGGSEVRVLAGNTAAIATAIQGSGGLNKTEGGTLVLSGANGYTGGTTVSGGVLSVSSDANLGLGIGGVTLNGGTLRVSNTGYGSTARDLTVGAGNGALDLAGDFHLNGHLSGNGSLSKLGTGTLFLEQGSSAFTGTLALAAGALSAQAVNALGASAVTLAGGATLALNGYSQTLKSLAGAGNVQLGAATLRTGADNTSTTLSGAITGTGSLIKQGTGNFTLSGANLYSGGTSIESGTLTAGRGQVLGTGGLTVANGALMDFNGYDQTLTTLDGAGEVRLGSAALTVGAGDLDSHFAGALDGDGSLTKLGAGTLTLSGTSHYTGPTTVSAGTLAVDGAISGSALQVASGARLAGNGTVGSTTVASGGRLAPSGLGSLHIAGNLSLAAGAALDYQLGAPGTPSAPGAGSHLQVDGDLSLNGTLNLDDSAGGLGYYRLIRYGGALSGGGLVLGASHLDAGQYRIVQNLPGSIDLRIGTVGSNLLQTWTGGNGVWNTSTQDWTNDGGDLPVAWAGNHAVFMQNGGARIDVQGSPSFAGLQFVADGYRLQGNGRLLTQAGGSEIRVLGGNTATIATAIGGAGGIDKTEGGTLVLAGANDYAGGTRISGGVLAVSREANLGSGGLTLNGGTLRIADAGYAVSARAIEVQAAGGALDLPHDFTLQGALSGSGALIKRGAGLLTLTADSSAYRGAATLAAGGLWLGDAARLGGTLTARDGTLLGGTGTLGSTTVQAGAVHSPGSPIGTQTIVGDYVNRGTLRIDATPSDHDRLAVSGGVDIAGATLDLRLSPDDAASWKPRTGPYTLIAKQSPGAVVGEFARLNNPLLFMNASVDTRGGDGNDVTLTLQRNDLSLASLALTANQRAVAGSIEGLPDSHEVWRTVMLSTDAAALGQALSQLSGDTHAGVVSALRATGPAPAAQNGLAALRGNLAAPMAPGAPTAAAGASDAPAAPAALPTRATAPLWAQVSGDWMRLASDGNTAAIQQSSTNLSLGGDAAVGGGWRLGGAFGYTNARISGQDRAASAKTDSYTATLYGGKAFALGQGKLNVLAGAAYSWHDIDSRRQVRYGSLDQTLKADYGASSTQLFAEVGYALPLGAQASIEPFAGLSWNNLRMRGFAESGGSAALSGQAQSDNTTSTLAGLRGQWQLPDSAIALRGLLGWRHAYGTLRPSSTLAFDQGPAFSVAGAPIARDAARVELGADLVVVRNMTAGLAYAGEFGGGNRQHTGTLNVRWQF